MSNSDNNFDMGDFNMGDENFNQENPQGFEDYAQPENNFNPAQRTNNYGADNFNPQDNMPPRSSTQNAEKKIVNLSSDIPVQIAAVLGKKTITVKDLVSMKMGQVVELGRLPNEAIDLVANGKLVAKGELVEIDGRLGVRILKIFD